MARDSHYWDSDAFLGYFNEETDKHNVCASVLESANSGNIVIVTSALTLAEVLFAKPHPRLPKDKREAIEIFFKAPYISVWNVTRQIAEKARDYVWDHNIKPKDAIHIATAIQAEVSVLNTFDKELLSKSEKIVPVLKIEKPHKPMQTKLFS